MSISPPEDFLRDPASAFLEQPGFLQTGVPIPPIAEPRPDQHPDFAKIAVGIAAALVVLRLVMKHELAKQDDLRTSKEIAESANRIYKRVVPAWMQASVPAITQAYKLGATQAVSYDELEKMATDYASELGEYVNDSSILALTDGFNAQVNAGWSERLAWQRAREAYGLDSNQMRSYVKGLMAADKSNYVTDPVPAASRSAVDRAFLYRADRIGQNEAFKATQVGRNMVWLMLSSAGQLPPGTMKKWVTAEDELVCGVCGPLDQVVIPLHWRFETLGGEKFYAPGVHPNCRCTLELVYPDLGEDVVKMMPGDPYDRNVDGEFAESEERSALPKAKAKIRRSALSDVQGDLSALESRDRGALSSLTALSEPSALSERSALDEPSALSRSDAKSALSSDERRIYILQDQSQSQSAIINPEDPQKHDADLYIPATPFLEKMHINPGDLLTTQGPPINLSPPVSPGEIHYLVGHEEPLDQGDLGDSVAFEKAFEDYMRFHGNEAVGSNKLADEQANEQKRNVADPRQFGVGLPSQFGPARRALIGMSKDEVAQFARRTIASSQYAGYYMNLPTDLTNLTANDLAQDIVDALVAETADNTATDTPVNDGAWSGALYSLGEDRGSNAWTDEELANVTQQIGGSSEKQWVEPVFFKTNGGWYGSKMPVGSAGTEKRAMGEYKVTGWYTTELPPSVRSEEAESIMDRILVVELEHVAPPEVG